MLPLKEMDRAMVRMLLSAGCCPRCVLRFCFVGTQTLYRLSCKELRAELHEFLCQGDATSEETDELQPPPKKVRLQGAREGALDPEQNDNAASSLPSEDVHPDDRVARTCTVCLGVLQALCEKDFIKLVCGKVESAHYQYSSLVFSVSLPPQLLVREHATWLLVKQEMGHSLGPRTLLVQEKRSSFSSCGYLATWAVPAVSLLTVSTGNKTNDDFFSYIAGCAVVSALTLLGQLGSWTKDDVLQLKEVYKWVTHPLLSEELGVPVDGKSLFEVSVIFSHPETDGDCHFLASVCRDCFRPTKNKQSVFTRMAVVKALEKIKDSDFRQQFCLRPEAPMTACVAEEIQSSHTPVYVAGRYNKFSRNLPQTPWVIDGERKMESSVEELIAEPLAAIFKSDSFNFSSSGREDVDVRTLGYGRPFAIELLNPHRWFCTQEKITELQQQINKSTDKIRVRDLQIVTREAVSHMKEGEEEKTKCYSALIWTQRAIERSDINFLQDMMELKLYQKTPLRVLHRRPLAVRPRVIHNMKVDYIDQHHFRLYLKTQAGTYIKEFVHGDFGRTKPNLGTLMKTTADILELDVESVDVDWPPRLDE